MTVKQLSSSTPSPPTPFFLSPSLPLWACRHYLMSLSFCAAGEGVDGGGGGGLRGCLYQQTVLIQPHAGTGLSQSIDFSDQIKYLTYNLYIFLLCLPVSMAFSTRLLPSTGGLWDMFVRGYTG